ncbi:hypothetical protein MK280_03415 [Myxococcota bacterium]|nr:hypothetical protein [Myxococcota bacterium]
MRFVSSAVGSGSTVLGFASPALAGEWGEDWGTMVWGAAAAVPSLEVVGVWLLAIAMMAAAGWRLRDRSLQASLMLVLIPLVPLLMAPHYTTWNGFTNGTVAESGAMNENFTTMQGGVNAALTSNPVSLPYTFTNGTPANADQVNANFTELETGVTNALANRATDCAGAGGTWDAQTSTCTRAYNCYIGGFCSQADSNLLPLGARVWTPAEVAACKAEPPIDPPFIQENAWEDGANAYDYLGPYSALHDTIGDAPTDFLDLLSVCK